MPYTYEQMTPFGTWMTVTADEAPDVRNGRIKTAEGQGPRVRNISHYEDTEVPEAQIQTQDLPL